MNFESYFKQYEALAARADAVFDQMKADFSGSVACRLGCSDCCHALFDLTLIEALFIKTRFDQVFSGEDRTRLIDRANVADRQTYKLKRQAFKAHQAGRSETQVLEKMAEHRVRCPALGDDDLCEIYEFRPITCRIYGIPTVIGGKGHTCGMSAFEPGQRYPTVKLDAINQRLYDISFALAQEMRSKYPKLAEMLVPLSMALLTDYSEIYLGGAGQKVADQEE